MLLSKGTRTSISQCYLVWLQLACFFSHFIQWNFVGIANIVILLRLLFFFLCCVCARELRTFSLVTLCHSLFAVGLTLNSKNQNYKIFFSLSAFTTVLFIHIVCFSINSSQFFLDGKVIFTFFLFFSVARFLSFPYFKFIIDFDHDLKWDSLSELLAMFLLQLNSRSKMTNKKKQQVYKHKMK